MPHVSYERLDRYLYRPSQLSGDIILIDLLQ